MKKNNFEVSSTVFQRLKEARINAGYKSALSFAKKHNIPFTSYRNHENGHRGISIEQAIVYSKLLNIHPAWLMTGEDYSGVTHKDLLSEEDIEKVASHLASDKFDIDTELQKFLFETALSLSPYLKSRLDKDYAIRLLIHTYKICITKNVSTDERLRVAKVSVEPLISMFQVNNQKIS